MSAEMKAELHLDGLYLLPSPALDLGEALDAQPKDLGVSELADTLIGIVEQVPEDAIIIVGNPHLERVKEVVTTIVENGFDYLFLQLNKPLAELNIQLPDTPENVERIFDTTVHISKLLREKLFLP